MPLKQFQRRILVPITLLAVVLSVVVLLAFYNSGRLIDAFERQVHTHEVLGRIDDVELTLDQATIEQRGFLITGDGWYLDQMHGHIRHVPETLAALVNATSDNQNQQRLLAELEPLVQQRLATMKEVALLRSESGFEAANKVIQAGAGQKQMQRIAALLGELRAAENKLLAERSAQAQSDARSVLFTAGAGALITFILVIVAFLIVRTELRERARLERDLTTARELALETARLKSEFLANMSHEIRTPMNGVIGMTELLQDMQLTRRQRDCVDTIQSSAMALLTIINDILDFSKIDAGKMKFESVHFQVRDVVEGVFDLLRDAAYKKNLEIAAFIDDAVPDGVLGDPTRLRQVLLNLVGNAIKFTSQGEVVVRVALDSESGDKVSVRFIVTDTGIGISDEARQRLFQPFAQADTSTTRRFGGTGLGLAISGSIVEMMGGRITVESTPGKGSSFSFVVPFQRSQSRAVPLRVESLNGLRVCVVDDHPINRELLQHQLGKWGMKVEESRDAATALELMEQRARAGEAFDAALLDLHMPEMDGLMLAREIRRRDTLRPMALALLSSSHVERSVAKEAGIYHVLLKPVRQSQLYDMLMLMAAGRIDASSTQMPAVVVPKSGARILVAEDNPVNQKVAVTQFERLGYTVHLVSNGTEALDALKAQPFDLVFMDCQMPELDGYNAARQWREHEEKTGIRVPIVALTAHAMEGEREKCLSAGMDDYLSKPVTLQALKEALERFLAKTPRPRAGSTVLKDFDVALLKECAGEGGVGEIVQLYFEQMDEQMPLLEEAITKKDAAAVLRIAHTCAGSSGTCGVLCVAKLMKRLEEFGRSGSLEQAAAELKSAKEELERARRFLAHVVAQGQKK
ncbi:MAG TPA: response regulator [Planctomycetota bacterium]|nr:response regulator [Planctomycetota bacterium]